MAINILNCLSENSAYIYVLAIVATILAVVISTRYTLRRLFKNRSVDEPSENTQTGSDSWPCDNAAVDSEKKHTKSANITTEQVSGPQISPRYPDPVDYCEHIQGEFKRVQHTVATRTIKKSLTDQQIEEEKEVQRKQLEEIFRLMQEQQDRFGMGSMDEMKEQMKLYAL